MQQEEKQLIDKLFERLKKAENQTPARDAGAEGLIKKHLHEQPYAPYYMTQVILIQEAALSKLTEKVSELENHLAYQRTQVHKSSGFLSGLFGASMGTEAQKPSTQQQPFWNKNAPSTTPIHPQQPYSSGPVPTSRSSGFLFGALQTAIGVAGGVAIADMLTNILHHSQLHESISSINGQPLPQVADHSSFTDQEYSTNNQSLLNQNSRVDDSHTYHIYDDDVLNDFGENFNSDNFI